MAAIVTHVVPVKLSGKLTFSPIHYWFSTNISIAIRITIPIAIGGATAITTVEISVQLRERLVFTTASVFPVPLCTALDVQRDADAIVMWIPVLRVLAVLRPLIAFLLLGILTA